MTLSYSLARQTVGCITILACHHHILKVKKLPREEKTDAQIIKAFKFK